MNIWWNGGITKWLWFYIKKQGKDNFGVASLKHDNVYNDYQMKAELLNNYFTSVFTPHSSEPLPIISDTSFPDIATISVDINGVLNLPIFWNYVLLKSGSYFDTYISSTYPSIQCSTWLETSKYIYCPNIQKRRLYPLQ